MTKHRHRTVVLGGTFEQLHEGHEKLIRKALQVGDALVIGLSSNKFTFNRGKEHLVSSYESRLAELKKFLSEIGALERVTITPLDDPYGPAVSDKAISAIVVSPETLRTAFEINRIRTEKRMKPLQIYTVDFVLADDGEPISTTKIRRGLVNREGRSLKTE